MGFTVVLLDVLEIRRLAYPGDIPIHILEPAIQARVVVSYTPQHQLEMLLVDRVETHERGVELDVHFCDLLAEYEEGTAVIEHVLKAVEGLEDDGAVRIVVFLGGGETGFVDTFVEVGHHPAVDVVDLVAEFGGVEVKFPLLAAVG